MALLIGLAGSEVPTELVGRPEFQRREYAREGVGEYRFGLSDPRPKLPIRRHGTVQLARWGNLTGRSRALPRVAITRQERVDAGEWSKYGGVPIEIAATFWSHNGAWMFVTEGIKGILAPDESGWAVAFLICERASNHYRNMTRADWMPSLVRQRY